MLELRLLYDYAIGVPQQCHETKRVTASQQRLLTLVVSNSCDVELTQRLPTMPLDTNVQCTLIIEPQRKVTEEQSDMSPSLQTVSTNWVYNIEFVHAGHAGVLRSIERFPLSLAMQALRYFEFSPWQEIFQSHWGRGLPPLQLNVKLNLVTP